MLRNIAEYGFGGIYLIGAVFNLTYTLRNGESFYGSFADNAWFGPARTLIRNVVIPNATVFSVLLIALQVSVALLIFSRGSRVELGLAIGAAFSLFAALVSSVGGAVGNPALAALQFFLAYTR
jgi:hypothetical protein